MRIKFAVILTLFCCISCAAPLPLPTPTLAPTLIPTATITSTATPTLTLTPSPTSPPTPTETPTPTPTVTVTASPKVEAIKYLVGDKPEDWFGWNERFQGQEIKIIYTGPDSISKEPMELTDGNNQPYGKSVLWFTGEYLIGNEIRKIKIPINWYKYDNPKKCYFVNGSRYNCDVMLPVDLNTHKLSQKTIGWLGWEPGQVGTLFVLKDDSPNSFYFYDTDSFYTGKDELLNKFLTNGDPGINAILATTAKSICIPSDAARLPDLCQQDGDKVIIPGYK